MVPAPAAICPAVLLTWAPVILESGLKNFTELSAAVTSLEPKEGDLLIFPSYLYHSVSENLSDNDRIIISFNVDIDK